MGTSTELIRKLDKFDPEMRDFFLLFMEEVEEKTKIVTLGRADFIELKETVQRLAVAQERTEHWMEKLAEAQERTDQRFDELAEAQKRTDRQFKKMAEAQKEMEQAMKEMAQAQKETAQTLKKYVVDHEIVKKQLGGLAMSVGYGIEDKIIPRMKAVALREFDVVVSSADRRNVMYSNGKYDEVNIYCEGTRDGKPVFVIGEAKAQPGKKDFDNFSKMIERLKVHLKADIESFMVGYQYAPDVEIYADKHHPHIRRYKTFQIMTNRDQD